MERSIYRDKKENGGASPDIFPHYERYTHTMKKKGASFGKKRIVLLSDTHITNGGAFNREVYEKAVAQINEIPDIDFIIHLGDLTDNGTFLEYEFALQCLERLQRDHKFFIIPGNHDAKNVGHLLFEELFGSRTFEYEDEDFYILGLDSSIPDQDEGRIGIRTNEKTGAVFLSKSGKLKILCFHHPLIPIPLTGRERSAIIDAGDTLAMIFKSHVDIVLNGHRHISNLYSCTDGEKEIVVFNSGTTSCNKTRYRELFTYSTLDIEKNTVTLTTKKIMDDDDIRRGRYIVSTYDHLKPKKEREIYIRIVHIGNTHFTLDNFMEEIFQEAVRQINEIKADIVIHSGDITESNKLPEFELAASKLSHIRHPRLVIPGNNDLRTIGWDLFEQWIGPLEPFYEGGRLRVVGINSIDRAIESGIIGRRKMRETVSLLKEKQDDKINIVTFYSNLIPNPKTRFDTMLSDSGAVLKNFTHTDNNIHFILTGHDHVSFSLQIEDTIISSCGTLSSGDYLDLKGNSYSIIHCYTDGYVEIERVYIRSKLKEVTGRYWIDFRNHG
ncbi:MAG: metallophosphoesterase [Spirochaetales bacterium]|nr:metallophosphoesterase [Spirochaetales bacterium]